jgi:hypothetical protein
VTTSTVDICLCLEPASIEEVQVIGLALIRVGPLLITGTGQPLAPLLRAVADKIESEKKNHE